MKTILESKKEFKCKITFHQKENYCYASIDVLFKDYYTNIDVIAAYNDYDEEGNFIPMKDKLIINLNKAGYKVNEI